MYTQLYTKPTPGSGTRTSISYTFRSISGPGATPVQIHTVIDLAASNVVGLTFNMSSTLPGGGAATVDIPLITLIKIS
jgi:hypothetical protein